VSTGILVLNFGEPDEATLDRAVPYLERIFLQNAGLEGHADEAARARARELARDRAPGLVAEYEAIGGSPLNAQADAQARALEHVWRFLAERGLDLRDPDTLLYFSVHGTPVRHLVEGRCDRYVFEHCAEVARRLGADRYRVGFQNHANRRIRWTQPDNEDAIRALAERSLVVVPISFMHEQSETLAELDHELRAFAAEIGKEVHRVPVPHDDPGFPRFLAELVTRALSTDPTAGGVLSACRCCPMDGCWCTNGERDLPPSPYPPVGGEAAGG
jgi:ferrochelatase